MVLGDSLTWGTGLDASERYTAVLEAELRARLPKANVSAFNFGV